MWAWVGAFFAVVQPPYLMKFEQGCSNHVHVFLLLAGRGGHVVLHRVGVGNGRRRRRRVMRDVGRVVGGGCG